MAARILHPDQDHAGDEQRGADQAEAWAGKARRRLEPMLETLYAMRRRLATGAVAILAAARMATASQ